MVLLHGTGSSAATWADVAARLSAHHWVIAPDLRGHGLSGRSTTYSVEGFVLDLEALVDQFGLARFDLIGHSMGAVVAYGFAGQHPQRVRRLVLADMPPPDPAVPPRPVPDGPDSAALSPEHKETDWRAIAALRTWRNDPPASWWPIAERIDCPTLVIGGRTSHLPQDRLQHLATKISDARFVALDAGHAVHTDAGERFFTVVDGFVGPRPSGG